MLVVAALGAQALGCGGSEPARPAADAAPPPTSTTATAPPELAAAPGPAAAPAPEFPPDTRSLRLTRTVAVRLAPGSDAKQIGTIAQDTRVGWQRTADGAGCARRWVELQPRGWVCGAYLEATTRRADGVELPRLARGELVPGVYGRVTEAGATTYAVPPPARERKGRREAPPPPPTPVPDGEAAPPDAAPVGAGLTPGRPLLGAVTVRRYGELTVGGTAYWKISRGNEYVARRAIREHEPSAWRGSRLGDDTGLQLPVAFVWPKAKAASTVWTRRNARGQGALRQAPRRELLPVIERVEPASGRGPAMLRVGATEWLAADQVRLVEAAEPPAGVGDHERWFDVDLDLQVLVAYEGRLPVYVTLLSSGRDATPSETGLFRVWKKISETDMNGLSGEDPYSVATVPWTQFYDPLRGMALHTAYWHDGFGGPRSHGCLNLSPADARWLYFWSEPLVPPGWTMAAGVAEAPGSVVRLRSAADPKPAWKGYARRVQELRGLPL